MKFKQVLLVLAASAFLANEAHAALYFEQDVHMSRKGTGDFRAEAQDHHFKRKIYVRGEILAIQVEEEGRLKKEYGFDFEKNLYYEADPEADYYKLFDLEVLGKAFERMGRPVRSRSSSRGGIVRDLSESVLEGRANYPVHLSRDLFGSKQFDGRTARRYTLRAGPGSFVLNPFGWYVKTGVWASEDVPGFAEYAAAVEKLRKRSAFYKIKHNRISDLIVTLSALDAFPLEIDFSAKRRFGLTTSKETSREVTTAISTAPIEPEKLLYLKEAGRFSWDVVYSEGTYFGREVSLKHGDSFNPKKQLPWLVLPVFFVVFTFLWFGADVSSEDRLSLRKFLIARFYVLASVLLALQITHTFREIPYFISPWVEFSLIFLAGFLWIAWRAWAHLRAVKDQMEGAHLRYCPYCKARIEVFYLVCPKCNRSIKA
ncbi:MAG TPA: hypothetical protein VD883_01885 [Candidatus Omnitrophota bacterium]|nr:hypothetical protein [Candidatus Omnitrophota bacterium]